MLKEKDKWQFGDFQTPLELARLVVSTFKKHHDIKPTSIIEPTCGKGAFLIATAEGFPTASISGFEVNPSYVAIARELLSEKSLDTRVSVSQSDFFLESWDEFLECSKEPILIIGNPPWVTSSELGILNSQNLPEKTNFQGRRGIEAITGSGNFDISEWMILEHTKWLRRKSGAIAFLCKYSVARKVMRQLRNDSQPSYNGHIYKIDAKKHFSASVDACLFVLTKGTDSSDCEVFSELESDKPEYVIGARDGYVLKNVDLYEKRRNLKGQDIAYVWRSGLKHDCSKVMELTRDGEAWRNGLKEVVDVEEDLLFPLLKSSDIGNGRTAPRKHVIVTQKYPGQETKHIKDSFPKTWSYLNAHKIDLESRRSTIYKNKPDFSIFGVGSYTFLPWKIAISGLYKKLNFCLVGPIDQKPVIFDDTVNFLYFQTREEAKFVLSLLESKPALEFFNACIFWDEKRPITTEILRRLSIKELAKEKGVETEYFSFVGDSAKSVEGQMELGIAERKASYNTKTESTTRR